MDVFDAATNALLDTRTISNFSGGVYVTWTVTGIDPRARDPARRHECRRQRRLHRPQLSRAINRRRSRSPARLRARRSLSAIVIPIAANAGDPDGTVASVAFYADGQLLNTDTSAPYAFNWTNAPAGTHTLTAVATDDESQPTTSAPITISVAAPAGRERGVRRPGHDDAKVTGRMAMGAPAIPSSVTSPVCPRTPR